MKEINPNERERYPLNSEGDFYVENGICLCCMVPEVDAPELMGFDEGEMHCYFKRQPMSPEELEHAIAAVATSDIQGLRYAGNDEYVLRRLVELGAADCCDAIKPKEKVGGSVKVGGSKGLIKSCVACLKIITGN